MTDITANVIVSMPSQLFTMARSFKAVANGKIYIGKIDTDPVNPENQIQVYVENEDGSHVPVSQPIIINAAGYPVYNGQIAKFVTVQGHSMAVYDAYGAQQFYFPNVLKYDPDQLRQELGSGVGANLVGYTNPESGTQSNVGDTLGEKLPNIIGNVNTPIDGFKFSSFKTYHGDHDYQFILSGTEIQTTKRFKKTGNATVTLKPGQSSSAPEFTVDTVAYVDSEAPSYETFPQRVTLRDITLEADDLGGECGLAINAGQAYALERIGVKNAKTAIWMNDVWLTTLTNIATWGQIRQNGGTSTTYTNVWCASPDAYGDTTPGAFRLENVTYSNLIGCASDGTTSTAYVFDKCSNINLLGCGCEQARAKTLDYGSALAFLNENTINIDSFRCLPIANDQSPLISINGTQNRITINNFRSGGTYKYDVFIHGPGNNLVFTNSLFESGELPVIGSGPYASGSTVVVNTPGNKYLYRATGASESIVPEPFISKGSLDGARITFGTSTVGISGASADIKFRKCGSFVTVEFSLELHGFSGQTGAMKIRDLPYPSSNRASGIVSIATGLQPGVGSCSIAIERGATSIDFYHHQTPATIGLLDSNISTTSKITGSITYIMETLFE
ncbi:phage head-binding domain-containing protein [Escherichia coli]|uniref:phage head-binding domain-containing protein n=1 Tax=Escherichia coli TaxID=562 RepID=UPI001F493B4F|nr:phage head-binding domain-containing protein [Escherichia coli]